MAWISFPNLLPTFFVKESLFSLAYAVGTPIHLQLIKLGLAMPHLPDHVRMDIENEDTGYKDCQS